jgi:two-component system, NarL family, sensor histidine kinase UhpB
MRPLLRVPLFYKILVANALIAVAALLVGSTLGAGAERWTLALVGALVVTVLVNALIVRLALTPVRALEEVARSVQDGSLEARVPESPLVDRDLERVIHTFNGMLDALASYRRRLREVAGRALQAEEEERKRVSRELHDETAQALAALRIRLHVALESPDAARREAVLEEVREGITEALDGVRRMARGLRPPALDELGLVAAIEAHARTLQESTTVEVRVEREALPPRLPAALELAVYRIVQEALTNALRHADATRITVRLEVRDGWLRVEVSDDGRGFEAGPLVRGERIGLGIGGMQERARYLGGEVEIESRHGEGTRVLALIPVEGASGRQKAPTHGPRHGAGGETITPA